MFVLGSFELGNEADASLYYSSCAAHFAEIGLKSVVSKIAWKIVISWSSMNGQARCSMRALNWTGKAYEMRVSIP